jgi:hypothetical protein
MFFRVLLCIIFVFVPSHLMAGQAQGDIGVNIISPRTMDLKSLRTLCKDEPQTIACELYNEKILDKKTNKKSSYSVYTANFQ